MTWHPWIAVELQPCLEFVVRYHARLTVEMCNGRDLSPVNARESHHEFVSNVRSWVHVWPMNHKKHGTYSDTHTYTLVALDA